MKVNLGGDLRYVGVSANSGGWGRTNIMTWLIRPPHEPFCYTAKAE